MSARRPCLHTCSRSLQTAGRQRKSLDDNMVCSAPGRTAEHGDLTLNLAVKSLLSLRCAFALLKYHHAAVGPTNLFFLLRVAWFQNAKGGSSNYTQMQPRSQTGPKRGRNNAKRQKVKGFKDIDKDKHEGESNHCASAQNQPLEQAFVMEQQRVNGTYPEF